MFSGFGDNRSNVHVFGKEAGMIDIHQKPTFYLDFFALGGPCEGHLFHAAQTFPSDCKIKVSIFLS